MDNIESTPESATRSTRPMEYIIKKVSEQDVIIYEKTRGGSSKKDKYYIDPKSSLEFYSEKDAARFIKDGNTERCRKQPRPGNEEVLGLVEAAKMASGYVATAEVRNSDVEMNPEPPVETEYGPHEHDQTTESLLQPKPKNELVMQEPVNTGTATETHPDVTSQLQLPVQDSQIGMPIESQEFIIPYDVTSYPFWNSVTELEDEAYWANWAANHNNTQSGSPSNAPSQNLSEDNRPPADGDNESSLSKK